MKRFNYSFFVSLVFAFLIFSVVKSYPQQVSPFKSKFSIGIFNWMQHPTVRCTTHSGYYDFLNINFHHSFTWRGESVVTYGGFLDNLDSYKVEINSAIAYGYPDNSGKIFERNKIIRPAYGQRSTYNAEHPLGWQNKFPCYYYTNKEPDNPRTVTGTEYTETLPTETVSGRYCTPGLHSAGYIVKDLYENLEQVDFLKTDVTQKDVDYYISDDKNGNGDWKWYIKPRMRIPQSVTLDPNMLDVVVVTLEVVNFYGDVLPNATYPITVRNFIHNGSYNGDYIEIYYDIFDQPKNLIVTSGEIKPTDQDELPNSKVDYRIKWEGNVEVYLDYVRVDDEWAHFLFEPDPNLIYDFHRRIQEEVQEFSGVNKPLQFFDMDENAFNNTECMAEVNRIIKSINPQVGLCVTLNEGNRTYEKGKLKKFPKAPEYIDYLLSVPNLMTDVFKYGAYPFINSSIYPSTLTATGLPKGISYVPASNPNEYNNYLNNNTLDLYSSDADFWTQMNAYRSGGRMIKQSRAQQKNIDWLCLVQLHNMETTAPYYTQREPTNEEIKLQTYLAMVYGAKHILYYCYGTWVVGDYHDYGLFTDQYYTEQRINNYFGQNKWQGIANINQELLALGNVMYPDGQPSKHLIYEDSRTVNKVYNPNIQWGLPFLYVEDIRSFAPYINGVNPCANYNINTNDYFDCPDERYWELGFFNPPAASSGDISKYFIALNKRCTPDEGSGTDIDTRRLKIKFKSTDLAGYNNWMIKDAVTDEVISTFNKNTTSYVDAGEYKPAEAKLLKFIPVLQEGGTLAGDETLSGNINCNGMIYNGGHNITISPNAVVTFSDSAGIVMNGGCFVSNENADNVEAVILTGKTETTFWKGITLIGCDSIGVYNTNISNIKANDTAKAFSIINSYKVHFRKNNIIANSNSGGIQAVYNSFSDNPIVFNIRECNFNMKYSAYSAISILSNASVTLPIVTEWCTFISQNDTSNAILFNEVTGGAIKNNTFTNFGKSVVLMYSTTDFYGNIILGKDNSQGILCLSGSYASLSPTSGQYLGGYNYIKNYGTSANNVYSNNSYFNINNGQNDFDLSDIDNSKHLTGDLSGIPYSYVNAMKNCFHKDSVTNIDATHSVVWYDNSLVNFIFTDYSCELTPPGDYFVYQYGGYNDTVYYSSGGEGSGYNPNKPMNIEENVYKSLKDSININLRKRNYLTVEDKAKQLLTQYPDSLESATMVQKLYMASLSLDSTKIGITKTFLENLISANTQNPTLIKRAFYFIQKCKVKLGQYQSALDGFQYIMTQNPYTYEGLVASWDYAATYLLMGAGGSYKGDLEQTTEELNTPADTLLNRMTKSDINTNKSKNTNSNRNSTEQITKTFYEKIKNVTKDDKTAQEEKVKTLEKKIETTKSKNEKSDAITELATMKQIKEVVKLKKPNTIVTHTAIINNDIKKVFGIGKGNKDESTNSLIPQTYTLYQNYPNPFNPTTKIAYDIPRDAKVKLVIYDILGREMKTLVNNEFRSAGKYITEFNGSNLASGIYFARILVNEGKDFISVKKMVLVK